MESTDVLLQFYLGQRQVSQPLQHLQASSCQTHPMSRSENTATSTSLAYHVPAVQRGEPHLGVGSISHMA
eukprot:6102123-Amphidinium_carterae.1